MDWFKAELTSWVQPSLINSQKCQEIILSHDLYKEFIQFLYQEKMDFLMFSNQHLLIDLIINQWRDYTKGNMVGRKIHIIQTIIGQSHFAAICLYYIVPSYYLHV